jgi:hypothetical protein
MTITFTNGRTVALRWWHAAVAAAVIAGLAVLAACSGQLNDLGGIQQASPDYALTYLNVSDFPNVTLICIRGVGFATTTRTGVDLVMVPQWGSFCATKQTTSPRPAPTSTATGS